MSTKSVEAFTRRSFIIGAGKSLLFSLLGFRLYKLQILEGEKYTLLAEGNRLSLRLTPALRGRLLDCQGRSIAVNENTFRLVVLVEKTLEISQTLESLSGLIDCSELDLEAIEQDLKKSKSLTPYVIKDNLSWEEVSAVELRGDSLPGFMIEVGQRRYYPQGKFLGSLLGYVGRPSKDEDVLLPDHPLGKAGLEKKLEPQLSGSPGIVQLEVNARRKVVRELEKNPFTPGEDVSLSLHMPLQEAVMNILSREKSGAAVVIDVETGGILSLCSTPSYDPNLFIGGISQKNWKALSEDPYHPLTNKAISGQYAPGSTFKLIVALAALEEGVVDSQTSFFCPGYLSVNDHKFHCHKAGGHGSVSLIPAIAQSCDVFFYEVAKRLGIEKMASYARLFGLGASVLDDFPQEKKGLVPTKEWVKEKKNRKWTVSDSIMTSIGQGYLLSTPLQLAQMTSIFARGGTVCFPFLYGDSTSFQPLSFKASHMKIVQEGMMRVMNDPLGTSYKHRIQDIGREIAGKTGTSQVRRISEKERAQGRVKSHHFKWKHREHAIFVGYGPIHKPRFSTAVVIEHGGSGGAVAAPLGRDILWAAQQLFL